MALTTSFVARVDVPPQFVGLGAQAPTGSNAIDVGLYVVDVATTAAAGDYVSGTGLSLAGVLTACGITAIVGCRVTEIRTSANAFKNTFGTNTLIHDYFDQANNTLRLWVAPTAGGTYAELAAGTSFASGDIIRLSVVGL